MYNFEFTVKTSMEGQDVENICNTIAQYFKSESARSIAYSDHHTKEEGISAIHSVANNVINSAVQLIKSGVLEQFLPKKYVPAVCFLKEIVRKAAEEQEGAKPDAQPANEPENGSEAN